MDNLTLERARAAHNKRTAKLIDEALDALTDDERAILSQWVAGLVSDFPQMGGRGGIELLLKAYAWCRANGVPFQR